MRCRLTLRSNKGRPHTVQMSSTLYDTYVSSERSICASGMKRSAMLRCRRFCSRALWHTKHGGEIVMWSFRRPFKKGTKVFVRRLTNSWQIKMGSKLFVQRRSWQTKPSSILLTTLRQCPSFLLLSHIQGNGLRVEVLMCS